MSKYRPDPSGEGRHPDSEPYVPHKPAPAPPDREAREKLAREAAEDWVVARNMYVSLGDMKALVAAFLAFAESVEKMR